MKTSTSEVRCDHCRDVIPVMRADGSGTNDKPIYLQLRGARVGHRKFDFCNLECFKAWAPKIAVNAFLEEPVRSATEV